MVADGFVICRAANATDEGAVAFQRSETRTTALVSMRAALLGFHLDLSEDRKLQLPIKTTEIELADGTKQKIVIIRVKRMATKKAQTRPRKNKAGAAKAEPDTSCWCPALARSGRNHAPYLACSLQ